MKTIFVLYVEPRFKVRYMGMGGSRHKTRNGIIRGEEGILMEVGNVERGPWNTCNKKSEEKTNWEKKENQLEKG